VLGRLAAWEWHTRRVDDARTSAERRGPARPDAVLYPDIAAAGSLQRALQVELDQAGHQLTVLTGTPPGWRYVGARVEDDSRITSIGMGTQERAFVMEFWYVGVCMAHGTTEDVSGVAGATHVWQSGARVRELNEAWPFVRFDALAEAHERGEAAGYTWRRYLENSHQAPQLSRLHSFIALAIEDPRLRALLPYTRWTPSA
jgi:hypothetical protein